MRFFMKTLNAPALSMAIILSSFNLSASKVIAEGNGDAPLFAAYDQVNSADIEIAELGAIQGESRDVRAVAAMVLRDHSAVRQMARDIADNLGITYDVADDDEATQTHKAAYERLSGLSGADFDKAYLKHEAAFHRSAIEAVRTTLLPSTKEPLFQKHLEAVLPGFEHHLKATLEAAERLGYDIN